MQLKIGKTYRDASGRKVGPLSIWDEDSEHMYDWTTENGAPEQDLIYRADGTSDYNPALIEEWVPRESSVILSEIDALVAELRAVLS